MDALVRLLPTLALLPQGRSVVVHGLGAYGRIWLPLYDGSNRIRPNERTVATKLQRQLRWLHELFVDSLQSTGLDVVSLDPSTVFLGEGGRVTRFSIEAVEQVLDQGWVPVTYGGTLRGPSGNYSIVSSDEVTRSLAIGLHAARVVWITDVDGALVRGVNGDPEISPEFSREDYSRLISLASDRDDCTGGMRAKLAVALDLADVGIPSAIVNAAKAEEVSSAILGLPHGGTTVKAGVSDIMEARIGTG